MPCLRVCVCVWLTAANPGNHRANSLCPRRHRHTYRTTLPCFLLSSLTSFFLIYYKFSSCLLPFTCPLVSSPLVSDSFSCVRHVFLLAFSVLSFLNSSSLFPFLSRFFYIWTFCFSAVAHFLSCFLTRFFSFPIVVLLQPFLVFLTFCILHITLFSLLTSSLLFLLNVSLANTSSCAFAISSISIAFHFPLLHLFLCPFSLPPPSAYLSAAVSPPFLSILSLFVSRFLSHFAWISYCFLIGSILLSFLTSSLLFFSFPSFPSSTFSSPVHNTFHPLLLYSFILAPLLFPVLFPLRFPPSLPPIPPLPPPGINHINQDSNHLLSVCPRSACLSRDWLCDLRALHCHSSAA